MKAAMKLIAAFVLLQVGLAVAQTTYEIDWTVPADGNPLPGFNVLIGDTIIFNYGSDQPHDVYIHPNDQCEMQVSRIKVRGNNGPGVHTFERTGSHFFACDVGGHCEGGLNIRIFAYENDCDRKKAEGSTEECIVENTGSGDGPFFGVGDGSDSGSGSGNGGGGGGSGGSNSGSSGGNVENNGSGAFRLGSSCLAFLFVGASSILLASL